MEVQYLTHILQSDGRSDTRQAVGLVSCIVGGGVGFIGGSVNLGRRGVNEVDIIVRASGVARMNLGRKQVL